MNQLPLRRRVGLAGAVLTLVGYVIGASIFVLPGQLGSRAGPALVVSYLAAALLAGLACLGAAHIGSQLPVSGAIYVAVSRSVSPRAGFLVQWAILASIAVGIPVMAYSLADYLAYFVPGLSRLSVALAVVTIFGLVNLLPVRGSVLVQAVLTAGFLLMLYGFGSQAVRHADPGRFSPFFANGVGPVLGAAVGAYFAFTGFMALASIGEEIKEPGRTLPWALALSLGVVTAAHLLMAVAVTGLLEWRTLAEVPAPVATAAEIFLPSWALTLISVTAMLAAAARIHGVLLVHSRDVYALARDRVFPPLIGWVHPTTRTPAAAVIALTGMALLGVLAGGALVDYALLAVLGGLFMQVGAGIALLRMPSYTSPGRFALRGTPRRMVGVGLIMTSGSFALVGALERPAVALVFGLVMVAGLVYYSARRRVLAARGQHLDELFAHSLDS